MNSVFARRLKAQQERSCRIVDQQSHLQNVTNQENEIENSLNFHIFTKESINGSNKTVLGNSSDFSPEKTPMEFKFRVPALISSPTSDRYIPNRGGASWQARFSMLPVSLFCHGFRKVYNSTIDSESKIVFAQPVFY